MMRLIVLTVLYVSLGSPADGSKFAAGIAKQEIVLVHELARELPIRVPRRGLTSRLVQQIFGLREDYDIILETVDACSSAGDESDGAGDESDGAGDESDGAGHESDVLCHFIGPFDKDQSTYSVKWQGFENEELDQSTYSVLHDVDFKDDALKYFIQFHTEKPAAVEQIAEQVQTKEQIETEVPDANFYAEKQVECCLVLCSITAVLTIFLTIF